ncbi:MAG: ABC transporter permease [Solirubrobacteraceae bacterium]
MPVLLAKRVAAMAGVLVGLATIVFLLAVVIPADPARAVLGAAASPAAVKQKAHELGYDRPLPERYVRFMGRVLRGDLQDSLRTRNTVAHDLGSFLPATVELALVAAALAALLGSALGLAMAGGMRGRGAARLLLVGGASMPSFLLALLGILLFYSTLHWLPASGRLSDTIAPVDGPTGLLLVDSLLALRLDAFGDALTHIMMPATALALTPAVALARTLAGSLEQQLSEDYARTARAKGLRERTVLLRHALRNAVGPMLTMAGLQMGFLLGGVVVVEQIFAWPGIGLYTAQSIQYADFPAITGVTLVLGATYVVVNLLVDLAQTWADPRIRTV